MLPFVPSKKKFLYHQRRGKRPQRKKKSVSFNMRGKKGRGGPEGRGRCQLAKKRGPDKF